MSETPAVVMVFAHLKYLKGEVVSEDSVPFMQGMLNRLTIGSLRYGRSNSDLKTVPKDMVDTAILRAQVALRENRREGLIDAANFLVLAFRNMDDTEAYDGHSPGVVKDGVVTKARGMFEPTNGQPFEGGAMTVREPDSFECLSLVHNRLRRLAAGDPYLPDEEVA